MTNYVPFEDVQKEIKKIKKKTEQTDDDDYDDIMNCFGCQLCITISLTVYVALLIMYMCLVDDPPTFVYILLAVAIFGNSLIASFSLMNICQKRQSCGLWGTIYFAAICFVNSIGAGLGFYIYAPNSPNDSLELFGLFVIFLPGCLFLLASLILLFMSIFCCQWKVYYKDWINDLNDYEGV